MDRVGEIYMGIAYGILYFNIGFVNLWNHSLIISLNYILIKCFDIIIIIKKFAPVPKKDDSLLSKVEDEISIQEKN
jgi:hypothetical protein